MGGGGREPGWIGLGSVVTRWPQRVSEQGSEEGAGSRKSFVHSDPYRKLKTEPIQVVLLFAPLYDFSSSLRSCRVRPFCYLFESQATKSAKIQRAEIKRAEGSLSRHVSGEQYTACQGKTGISERLQRKKIKKKSIDSKSG